MSAVGVFLGVEPSGGGMFQYAQSVLESLRPLPNEGWRVRVACTTPLWAEKLRTYPFEVTVLEGGSFGQMMATALMTLRVPRAASRWLTSLFNPIASQLRRLPCDLWIFPAQDALGYQLDVTAVNTVHDLMHRYEPGFPEVSQAGRYAIREHRFRNLAHGACAVLVDSAIGRQHVVESYGVEPAKIHPLPYVAPRYIEQPEPADFDARYRLPPKFLFYPAQFWAHKNHARLLEASSRLTSRCPDLHWVFTGGHAHGHADLVALAAQLGFADRVQFPGYVPEAYLSGFYRRARAMVMPTFFGPTNIPPLEAFSCGCPVAISNTYGMPEQARGAALLFNPRSVDEIATAIERLWTDDVLCRQLAEAGRANARAWNQQHFGESLRRILRGLVAEQQFPGTP